MIYDISPSKFIDEVHFQYMDLFNLSLIAITSITLAFIDVRNQYVDTRMDVNTMIGIVEYRNTRMKT